VDTTLQTSALFIPALGDLAQHVAGRWDADGAVTGGRTLPYVLLIMSPAKALATTLAGTPSKVVYPLKPVAIKTPALSIVVATPAPGTPGEWSNCGTDLWQFLDREEIVHGFVLTGKQIMRRAGQTDGCLRCIN
jgi:rubredoxin-NAD+ reductase